MGRVGGRRAGGGAGEAATVALAAALGGALCVGCGGGRALLHPAHTLKSGVTSLGGGLTGRIGVTAPDATDPEPAGAAALQTLAVAPGVSPWVGARVGLGNDNEGGLTYGGRSLRVDARHAFSLGAPTLSVGLGASALVAERPGERSEGAGVYGGGFDLPLVLGVTSRSDLYSLWAGPRVGFEILSGRIGVPAGVAGETGLAELRARHFQAGFLVGMRVGFRHVHVAIELEGTYHRADGEIDGLVASRDGVTVTPASALVLTF